MNSRQKLVLGIGLGMVAVMLLFPPWIAHLRIPPACDANLELGYSILFLAPSETDVRLNHQAQRTACPVTADFNQVDVSVSIDFKRWLIPLALVIGIGATAFFAFSDTTTRTGRGKARSR